MAGGEPGGGDRLLQRKYESLETEVVLLEQRISSTDMAPAQASASVQRLLHTIGEANALGDLDGLRARLERLTEDVGHRREEAKAAREQARVQAKEIKERIVAEAEQIAVEATHWKSSGERMRELLEEWKAAPHAERAAEAVLWKRLSAARNAFTKRRKAYFANLEAEREDVKARKEKLCSRRRGAVGLDRLGRDHQRVPRADDAVEGGRAGRPGGRGRAVEAVPVGSGQVL